MTIIELEKKLSIEPIDLKARFGQDFWERFDEFRKQQREREKLSRMSQTIPVECPPVCTHSSIASESFDCV